MQPAPLIEHDLLGLEKFCWAALHLAQPTVLQSVKNAALIKLSIGENEVREARRGFLCLFAAAKILRSPH